MTCLDVVIGVQVSKGGAWSEVQLWSKTAHIEDMVERIIVEEGLEGADLISLLSTDMKTQQTSLKSRIDLKPATKPAANKLQVLRKYLIRENSQEEPVINLN